MSQSDKQEPQWLQDLHAQVEQICTEQCRKEMEGTYGYDYKASLSAISQFEMIALDIEAESAMDYMSKLRVKIQYAQANCANPGEYSGGKATYGTLLSNMQYWYDNEYCAQKEVAEQSGVTGESEDGPKSKPLLLVFVGACAVSLVAYCWLNGSVV